ncbi:hypothetical protein [Herminiimonas sp. CN]|uniref:hypothetical protein n=1 Tax=Herminiimonas sp. CN TaxID=1349818 RepID=UPI0012DEA0E9|nr:hypothetical protein [Herminiimonas sp. CN]
MNDTKLTPRQNIAITDALCALAVKSESPEALKEIRRALVNECEAINRETSPASLPRLHTYP